MTRKSVRPRPAKKPYPVVGEQPDGLDANESDRPSRHLNSILSGLLGILLGLGIYAAVDYGKAPPHNAESLQSENSVLVAQQLDETFKALADGLYEGNAQQSLVKIVRIFYLYDRKFIDQNQGSQLTENEVAYAAQRLARIATVFGDFEQANANYRIAGEMFAKVAKKNPLVISSHFDLVDSQSRIAFLENQSGNREHSAQAFRAANRIIESAAIPESISYDEWMVPLFELLSNLGIELELYDETLGVSRHFARSARRLFQQTPNDQTKQMTIDADTLLTSISRKMQLLLITDEDT